MGLAGSKENVQDLESPSGNDLLGKTKGQWGESAGSLGTWEELLRGTQTGGDLLRPHSGDRRNRKGKKGNLGEKHPAGWGAKEEKELLLFPVLGG